MAFAIMFHHFHSELHPSGQGSISAECLDAIISKLKQKHNLLSCDEFSEKCLLGKLKKMDVCLTFDDGLKSQYEVALPVLESWDLKAFFFVPSKPLLGGIINLEVFRYFRSVYYDNIDDFYEEFFRVSEKHSPEAFKKALTFCSSSVYRSEHEFYTYNDRLYRYFRDRCVNNDEFDEIMFLMIEKKGLETKKICDVLWMNKHEIKYLFQSGHEIGLHTHNHPTNIDTYTYEAEYAEYTKNFECLTGVLGNKNICSAALPCGLHSVNTKKIMEKIGVKLCFAAEMGVESLSDPLTLPRLDHVLLP